MTKASSFIPIDLSNRFRNLKSVPLTLAFMIIISFFLIGGCNNNSGSNQTVDARRIGQIDGVIVPALEQVLTIRAWKEGDPDGHLYLNGSRVATLTDAEKQAINNSYNMGYIVGLVSPNIDEILELHEVLGLDPIFADEGTFDLLAITREFNISGVRYYSMIPYQSEDNSPMPDDLNVDRVIALGEWAPIASSASSELSESLQLRETNQFDFTSVADSKSIEQYIAIAPKVLPDVGPDPDLRLVVQGSITSWSAHSFQSTPASDFYYFRASYSFTPSPISANIKNGCNVACDIPIPPSCLDVEDKGVLQYTVDNFQDAFAAPEVIVVASAPNTTTGTVTTSNSLSHSISENVSYSQEEGASVGISSGSTVSHSESFSAPAVKIIKEVGMNPPLNNSVSWMYDVFGTAVANATLSPKLQYILQATDATRTASGIFNFQQNMGYTYFPYSCWPSTASDAVALLNHNFAIPPLPTPCTMNSDCGIGQVCATEFASPVCGAQPCDESMTCPVGFACLNETCQPSG